jgi:ABC-type sugar transport system ATPase subunit
MSASALLSLRNIRIGFGAVQVLHGVDLDIKAGSVTALVGDNGAGKSTLIKCVAGIYQPDQGEMFWEGSPIRIGSPKAAAEIGIEFVYQDLALCDNLDVVQNMFLGREKKRGFLLDHDAMEVAAREVFAGLSVTTVKSVRQPVASLSGGQRQSIAVAKAVMWNSKLVILDEPTAALGVAQTRQVLDLVRRLAGRGLGVMIVSHNLEDVLSVSDEIAVLRLGRMVTQVRREEVDSQQLVQLITTGKSDRGASSRLPRSAASASAGEEL